MGAGRKPIYQVDSLEIGEKIEIKGKNRKFGHQMAYSFNKRYLKNRLFRALFEGNQVFIIREQ